MNSHGQDVASGVLLVICFLTMTLCVGGVLGLLVAVA